MFSKTILVVVFFAIQAPAALAEDRGIARHPDGTGDPDATTCRPPQPLPGSRMMGPQVCKTNSQWALLRKNSQDISPDGSQIISETAAGPAMNCTTAGGGASGGGMTVCH
jgi:hypothetical protein